MKSLIKKIAVCVIAVSLTACAPTNKESYMKNFDDFISEISNSYKLYTDTDWSKQAEKYDKLSTEWYEKFKNELSVKDEIAIKANQAKWYYYRNLNTVTGAIKQLFESLDIKGMKEQVQYYIDNDMQSDLQKFYEDAQKAGKDAKNAVAEILEELGVKIDELSK